MDRAQKQGGTREKVNAEEVKLDSRKQCSNPPHANFWAAWIVTSPRNILERNNSFFRVVIPSPHSSSSLLQVRFHDEKILVEEESSFAFVSNVSCLSHYVSQQSEQISSCVVNRYGCPFSPCLQFIVTRSIVCWFSY